MVTIQSLALERAVLTKAALRNDHTEYDNATLLKAWALQRTTHSGLETRIGTGERA